MEYSDKTLMQGLRTGDERAFEAMYEKFFPKVFNHVFLELQNQAEAEQVTGSIFFDLVDSLDKLPHDMTLSAWVYKLTRQHLARATPARRKLDTRFRWRAGEASVVIQTEKEAVSNVCVQR